jgi:hypothetical protein
LVCGENVATILGHARPFPEATAPGGATHSDGRGHDGEVLWSTTELAGANEWVVSEFDPEAPDLDEVNQAPSALQQGEAIRCNANRPGI